MIRVAVCDDEEAALEELSVLLRQYSDEHNTEIEITTFQAPLVLLDTMESGTRFDVLLLDILMPGINGIDTAADIRRFDSCVKIIFLSSSPEFAVQSYTVNAFYYLLKPVQPDSIFPILDSVFETCEQEKEGSIILNCKDGIIPVEIKRIEFCEVFHRTLCIHTTSGKIFECAGSLDNFEKQLEDCGCFIRIHRSFLINLNHIRSISRKLVTMSCMTEIPIPRGRYADIKNAFLENAFTEGKIEI